MRYARKAQAHFDSAQSPGEHDVVEAPQMADAKSFAREFTQTSAQRHIEIIQNNFTQAVRIVTLRREYAGHRIRIFHRLFANDLEPPGAYRSACGFAVPDVAAANVRKALFLHHFSSLPQTKKNACARPGLE